MNQQAQIVDAVYRAIDMVNQNLPEEQRLTKAPDTVLFGDSGNLDSLGLVNLIVTIEEELAASLKISLTIADERAMSQTKSPFQTVGTLIDYIDAMIKEGQYA